MAPQSGNNGGSSAGSDPVVIGNLRLFNDKRIGLDNIGYNGPPSSETAMTPKSSPQFKLLSHCIHLGLRFLESEVGNAALVETATEIIRERRRLQTAEDPEVRARGHNVYDKGNTHTPLGDMKKWVDAFLVKVRRDFPNTYATRTLPPDVDGMTQRCAWSGNMEQYQPKEGGRIYVHQCMIDQIMAIANAIDKYEEEYQKSVKKADKAEIQKAIKNKLDAMKLNYDTAVYHLAITFSHELCHLFTGYLTGSDRTRTPNKVSAAHYSQTSVSGEHGWAWEFKVFRGCTWSFVEQNWHSQPLRLQAGTPYAHDDDETQQSWYKLKRDFPRRMINLDFASITVTAGSKKYWGAFDPSDPLQRSAVPVRKSSDVNQMMMQAAFTKLQKVYPWKGPLRQAIPAVQRNVLMQLNTLQKYHVTASDISLPLRPAALRAQG